jgi:hypothetical protein
MVTKSGIYGIKDSSKIKSNDSGIISGIREHWEKGDKLMSNKKYKEAIKEYKEIAKLSTDSRKDAYFSIAIAYANLSFGDYSYKEQESYKDFMIYYVKEAASLGNEDAGRLLQKYEVE